MARKSQLRVQRTGTVINVTSKQQESDVIKALVQVVAYLGEKFKKKISLVHEKQWYLKDIVAELRHTYPETDFHTTSTAVPFARMAAFCTFSLKTAVEPSLYA